MPGERVQHRQQRGVRLRDRVVVFGQRSIDLGAKARHGPIEQVEEDRLLAGEVEVDAALGSAGLVGDLLNARVPIALAREDSQRRVEDTLLAGARPALLLHRYRHS